VVVEGANDILLSACSPASRATRDISLPAPSFFRRLGLLAPEKFGCDFILFVIGLFTLVSPLCAEPSESLDPLFRTATDGGRLIFSGGPQDEIRKVLVARGIHGPVTLTEFIEETEPSESLDVLWRATGDNMTFIPSADGYELLIDTLVERGMLGLLGTAYVPL